jgi:formiminotetrahydrofolate cyclodeaminase
MFKEYSLKDLFKSLLFDMPFYAVGCYMASDYIGRFAAGLLFIVFCLISIERARSEEQDKQIHALKEEIDKVKKELNDYKSQLLEG